MAQKVLVVDDNSDTLNLIKEMLAVEGVESELALNGELALSILEGGQTFDAIFLDIMMPGMNGYEVLNRIRNHATTRSVPVIMLTAQDRPEQIINGYQKGADYYVPKPFTRGQLMLALQMVQSPEGVDPYETPPVDPS